MQVFTAADRDTVDELGLNVCGLFELRPRGREGIGRVFYCFVIDRNVVILHAFLKKTPDTPEHELKIARIRMKEVTKWLN